MKSPADTIIADNTGEGVAKAYFEFMPVGAKLILCMGLAFCAFVARTPAAIMGLLAANALIYMGFRTGPIRLKGEIRTFFWQTLVILTLYGFRFGLSRGLLPGLITSGQLFFAFFPGVIFIRTTPQPKMATAFSRWMSGRSAFVLTTCLQFLPMMIRDIKSIYEAQVFRGARILPKDLVNPKHWPDLLHCLMFPVAVHCMVMASQIAVAAKSRDFPPDGRRTAWPGN